MKKFKQLIDENDLEGKIITKAIMGYNSMVLHFINDEFCILKCDGYEDHYIDIEDSIESLEPTKYNIDRLRAYGLINDAEFNELKNQYYKEEQEQQAANDKAKFEYLKKKYGF